MSHLSEETTSTNTVSRRALLRAGWVLPVIAVTPLLNTASAMSAVNCDGLLAKRDLHRKNGDRKAYDAIQQKLDANGCPC